MANFFAPPLHQSSKRRVFFSFHYQNDIWKVNQVRQSWRENYKNTGEDEGFFDASIWENSQKTGSDSLKNLIRNGMKNTSVTCVLVGAMTYERRWVRYELARSVIKQNGLLAVDIHLMGDPQGCTSKKGPNPLDYMGVYCAGSSIYLAELNNGKWEKYRDYTQAVQLPAAWIKPTTTCVIMLSQYAKLYCYKTERGSANFSSWVQKAALSVGR